MNDDENSVQPVDISARTNEDGILHVTLRWGGRTYQVRGRAEAKIEETTWPGVPAQCRFDLSITDAAVIVTRHPQDPAAYESARAFAELIAAHSKAPRR
ncbi:hypothetical protein ACIRYZ_45295 [Kitasatospora sp. NPDC101155]|uniref:hypothetical protein n=1 Tax=Kitasatospora sp. NPDC101155 TaxID=3364097 RepID=UPI0037F2A664